MKWQRAGLIAIISALGFASSACTDGYGYSGVGLGYNSWLGARLAGAAQCSYGAGDSATGRSAGGTSSCARGGACSRAYRNPALPTGGPS